MAKRAELWNKFKITAGLLAASFLFACNSQPTTTTSTVIRPPIALPPPTLTLPLPTQPAPRPENTPISIKNPLHDKLKEIYGHEIPIFLT